ncbi:hypothetical protein Moror_15310 [Moniliophthora roreri MCA 2997]|uniref:F-box domain-containing protein n=2 Tax=Moniliophthora roreri TaxID=221103 RepID=V2X1X0_MONRO|nr:hypothetical protein Moror_15310 [Moniliophthora roreri MCA 2997]KAI3603568.1 hypothetical protein WG66_006041 [Moniliophthora roreri]
MTETANHRAETLHLNNPWKTYLPLEVILLIFKEFDPETEGKIFMDMSLVCREWREATQAKLFAVVQVNSANTCKLWSRRFKESPHLGRHVRELWLSDPNDDCMGTPYMRSRPAKTLVAACCNVRRLELDDFKRWGPVEQRVVKSLQSIEELRVDDIPGLSRTKDLPDLVYNLPNLIELAVGQIGEKYDYMDLPSIHQSGLVLREQMPKDGSRKRLSHIIFLSSEISSDIFLWMTGPAFDHSRLETLSISWWDLPDLEGMPERPNFAALTGFLYAVGPQLRSLFLGLPSPSESAHVGPYILMNRYDALYEYLITSKILSRLHNLRVLEICGGPDDCDDSTLALVICSTEAILKTLKAPFIQRIELEGTLVVNKLYDPKILSDMPQWKALDKLVSGDVFPVLQGFSIKVNCRKCWCMGEPARATKDTILSEIKASFPSSVAKSLLDLDVS